MNRLEMVNAVKRLNIADGTEAELDLILHHLVNAAPNSAISDLIYYPDAERTPEQIVDEALRREKEYAARASQGQKATV